MLNIFLPSQAEAAPSASTEGRSGSRAGRGEVSGMDRIQVLLISVCCKSLMLVGETSLVEQSNIIELYIRPTKRSYNYQNRVQRYKKILIYANIGDRKSHKSAFCVRLTDSTPETLSTYTYYPIQGTYVVLTGSRSLVKSVILRQNGLLNVFLKGHFSRQRGRTRICG